MALVKVLVLTADRQVQDLEKQLFNAKQQINQLRSMLQDNGAMAVDQASVPPPQLNLPEAPPTRDRQNVAQPMERFDNVRKNIRNYSRGIFKPPQAYRHPGPQPLCSDSATPLPPKHVTDRLLAQYHGMVHRIAPCLHWPTFTSECEELYRRGTFQGLRVIWKPLFFAVLACGTLMDAPSAGKPPGAEGSSYAETAIRNINTMTDETTIDHARTSLLLSMYFTEMNLKSAGWVWLASAIKICQDAGLYSDSGSYPHMDMEMRRRIWWSIYSWDR